MKLVWLLVGPLVASALGIAALTVVGTAGDSDRATSAAQHSAAQQSAAQDSASQDTSVALVSQGFYWQLTALQPVLPGQVLLTRGAHRDSKGTRSDDQFFKISSTGSNDVPAAALRAYHHAEKVMATAAPDCQISWTLLAAIGRVESNHGRFGGSQLGADGISRPEIRGPQLDGAGAFAAISDTDNGRLDHDVVWDRAVGQMQFLPETWSAVARDGDGDGAMNPDDIDDSALGSAVYLCGAGGSLADQAGMARAAFRYNHSDYYVQLVLSFQAGYQTGVFAVPSPPPPPAAKTEAKAKAKAKKHATAKAHQTAKPKHTAPAPAPKPAATPKPAVPQPSATPKPTPTPAPSTPKLTRVDGTWNACGPAYCLGGNVLDLGPQGSWNDGADADFDGDGTVESTGQEFAGLVDQHVTLQVERKGGTFVVYVIGNHGLRNADGSFARSQLVGDEGTS
jgi:membrane-bound lytic murein transglycosylase B